MSQLNCSGKATMHIKIWGYAEALRVQFAKTQIGAINLLVVAPAWLAAMLKRHTFADGLISRLSSFIETRFCHCGCRLLLVKYSCLTC